MGLKELEILWLKKGLEDLEICDLERDWKS